MLQDEDKELDTKELLKVFRRMPSQMLGYFLLFISSVRDKVLKVM